MDPPTEGVEVGEPARSTLVLIWTAGKAASCAILVSCSKHPANLPRAHDVPPSFHDIYAGRRQV